MPNPQSRCDLSWEEEKNETSFPIKLRRSTLISSLAAPRLPT